MKRHPSLLLICFLLLLSFTFNVSAQERADESPAMNIEMRAFYSLSEQEIDTWRLQLKQAIAYKYGVLGSGTDEPKIYAYIGDEQYSLMDYSIESLELIKHFIDDRFPETVELITNPVLSENLLDGLEKSERPSITFRDIEWGIPYSDVVKEFPTVSWFLLKSDYASPVRDDLIDSYKNIIYDDYVRGYTYSISDLDINVAGYPVNQIRLWFAYTPNEAGILQADMEHTAFYEAEYVFKTKDMESVKNDLVEKLSSLYGEYADSGKTSTYSVYSLDDYYIWDGTDTSVSLKTESRNGKVRVFYAWNDGDELLKQAYDCLAEAEKTTLGNGNTDGL